MSSSAEQSHPKLLIIEDHYETKTFLTMALGDDYDVDTATNAKQAWKLAEQTTYDLLLVDIALRDEVDGITLVAQLREDPRYVGVPMIATTAHQHYEEEEFYLTHGFDAYLAKPYYPEMLLKLIEELLADGGDPDRDHRPHL